MSNVKIFSEISKNENYIKSAMYIPLSADAIFRSFAVNGPNIGIADDAEVARLMDGSNMAADISQ